jgi:hypothetical protein
MLELLIVLTSGALNTRRARLWLLKTPYVLPPLMFGPSLDTLRADDLHRGLAAPGGPKLSVVTRALQQSQSTRAVQLANREPVINLGGICVAFDFLRGTPSQTGGN